MAIISQLNLHVSSDIHYTCKPGGPLKAINGYTRSSYRNAIKPQVKGTHTKYIELHLDSLRDIEKLTDLVIEKPLANATSVPFFLIFVGNISLSKT